MTYCVSCGAENADGTRFCVRCGATIAPVPEPESWKASGNLGNQGAYSDPNKNQGDLGQWAPPVSGGFPVPGLAGGGSLVGQLNYALWADRVLGAVIDGVVVMGVMVALFAMLSIISMVLGAVSGASGAAGSDATGGIGAILSSFSCCFAFVLIPVSVFVGGLFNTVYLVSKRGSSIGQGLMGLKVVDAQGGLLPFGSAFVRLLARVGLGFIPVVGGFLDLLWPLWDEQRQTLHDKAVGSFVIKTK